MSLQQLLNEHVLDSKNPQKIYNLACEYDRLGQGAMAVSLYIRAADIEEYDNLLQYKCMIGAGKCYQRQGNRNYTVVGLFQHAAALIIDRPEAHYFLAKHYESINDWQNCLIHSRMGLKFADQSESDIGVGYPGEEELLYLEAIANWHITGTEPSRQQFFDLRYKHEISDSLMNRVKTVINNIGYPDTIPYKSEDLWRYKFKFPGIEKIKRNYSKHFQDMFVLSILNGKRNGTYIEIGSGNPFIHNNTALLETQFEWRGVSIDANDKLCYEFSKKRRNTVIQANALDIDYRELFIKHCMEDKIDFLQIDCDEVSLEVLKRIPFKEYRFNVVQFEHDSYRLDPLIKEVSRNIMLENGYVLLVNDVAFNEKSSYEDWYVHTSIADSISSSFTTDKPINFIWNYMMKGCE